MNLCGRHRLKKSGRLFFRGRRRVLVWRRRDDHRHGITHLHHVVHQHFDEIRPGGFEFHLAENHDVGGVQRRVASVQISFRALRSTVVWSGAMSRTVSVNWPMPAVQRLKTQQPPGDDRQLRHADEIDDADEEKIAVGFLADFLAQQRALQVGENSGGLHKLVLSWLRFQKLLVRSNFRRAHGVLHQHGNGHRPDAAGIGRDFAGDWLHGGKIHVAHQPRAVLAPASLTRFTPTSITVAPGLTMSAFTNSATPIAAIKMSARRQCALMSRVAEWQMVTVALASLPFLAKHRGHRFADDVAAAQNHDFRAVGFHPRTHEQFHDARRRAGRKPVASPSISLPTFTG